MIEFDPVLVHEWLARTARRLPYHTGLVCGDNRLTYAEIDHHANRFASALMDSGIRRGDRVVVHLGKSVETVVAIYGIMKAGGTFVVLDGATVKASKLGYILEDSGAKALVSHVETKETVVDCFKQYPHVGCSVIWVEGEGQRPPETGGWSFGWNELLSLHPRPDISRQPRGIDSDLAAIVYTSGDGGPKGVMETHRNMIAAAKSITQCVGNEENDVVLDTLPLSLDYGMYRVITTVLFGGTMVFGESYEYINRTLDTIETEGVTGLPIVPAVAALLQRKNEFRPRDLKSLRYIVNTGGTLSEGQVGQLRAVFPNADIMTMYGITECSQVSRLAPEEFRAHPTSMGRPIPNCEVSIKRIDGKPLGPNDIGELVVRGANVMQGYWNSAEDSESRFFSGLYPADRRVLTGDHFRMDEDGYLYRVGPKDDTIISAGERISAKEVENVILEMEGIGLVAVIGVRDEILGHALKAFVLPEPGASIKASDVTLFCRKSLEPIMVPKYIELVDELPANPSLAAENEQYA